MLAGRAGGRANGAGRREEMSGMLERGDGLEGKPFWKVDGAERPDRTGRGIKGERLRLRRLTGERLRLRSLPLLYLDLSLLDLDLDLDLDLSLLDLDLDLDLTEDVAGES
mmetsp:Transcript_666/g.1196  ORF Transcript_666/g.1196 Transcript_666/m.1196 type:complete len:110 (-) Transcript_666:67-396(-)